MCRLHRYATRVLKVGVDTAPFCDGTQELAPRNQVWTAPKNLDDFNGLRDFWNQKKAPISPM